MSAFTAWLRNLVDPNQTEAGKQLVDMMFGLPRCDWGQDHGIWQRSQRVPYGLRLAADVPDLRSHRVARNAGRFEHRRKMRPVLRSLRRQHVCLNAGNGAIEVLKDPFAIRPFSQQHRQDRLYGKQAALNLRPELVNGFLAHDLSSLRSVAAQHRRIMRKRKLKKLPVAALYKGDFEFRPSFGIICR